MERVIVVCFHPLHRIEIAHQRVVPKIPGGAGRTLMLAERPRSNAGNVFRQLVENVDDFLGIGLRRDFIQEYVSQHLLILIVANGHNVEEPRPPGRFQPSPLWLLQAALLISAYRCFASGNTFSPKRRMSGTKSTKVSSKPPMPVSRSSV